MWCRETYSKINTILYTIFYTKNIQHKKHLGFNNKKQHENKLIRNGCTVHGYFTKINIALMDSLTVSTEFISPIPQL